ncbi:MAG: major facilitator superfamily 1, partial [Bryobacterales bacterium]|nr:major facilitator superfamily 1 [Bryobacterales bacterium]
MKLSTFRAFRQRNFRLFFVGQCLSVSGTWAQRVAQAWLAYSLTHSSFYLGLVTFAASAP